MLPRNEFALFDYFIRFSSVYSLPVGNVCTLPSISFQLSLFIGLEKRFSYVL